MTATALLVFVLSLTVLLLAPPKYTGTALMIVHEFPKEADPQYPHAVAPKAIDLEIQVDILRSPLMMSRLIGSLALHNDPEWNPDLPADQTADGALAAAGSAQPPPYRRVEPSVLEQVSAAVDVRRRPGTALIEVSATSARPERAAQMANQLVDLIVAYHREARLCEAPNCWLRRRMQELSDEAAQKQAALEHYRAQMHRTCGCESRVRLIELEREAMAAPEALEAFKRNVPLLSDPYDLGDIAPSMALAATTPSSPSSPSLPTAFLLSIGLGLLSGLTVGFLREMS